MSIHGSQAHILLSLCIVLFSNLLLSLGCSTFTLALVRHTTRDSVHQHRRSTDVERLLPIPTKGATTNETLLNTDQYKHCLDRSCPFDATNIRHFP